MNDREERRERVRDIHAGGMMIMMMMNSVQNKMSSGSFKKVIKKYIYKSYLICIYILTGFVIK